MLYWACKDGLLLWFTIWKEKQSGKLSTSLKPEESSLWRGSKKGNILLR